MKKEEWKNRYGFLIATMGSAIGLGSIWRFPYITYENGGGAFLIPYFFALFTAGIPMMILEFSLGNKARCSAPLAFGKFNVKWEWLGWFQIIISFIITLYYVVIVGWSLNYLFYSLFLSWGKDVTAFFVKDFLHLTKSPFNFGSFRLNICVAVILVWGINYIILIRGIKRGIEVASKIFMPLLFLTMFILLIRSLSLKGSKEGLDMLFTPDFKALLKPDVWIAAYGQVFFTLSVAFGIMIAYSSYLPENSELVNSSFIVCLLDTGFSIISAIVVFAVVGFLSVQRGGLPENLEGIFLAFVTFPEAINQMPGLNNIIGVIFFSSIFFAGIASHISINEVVVSGLIDKFNISRKKVVSFYFVIVCIISLIFVTGSGLHILSIVDHFVTNISIVLSGFLEIILLSWFYDIVIIKKHINRYSDFNVGIWWTMCVKYITPVILGVMFITNFINNIMFPYKGYNFKSIFLIGWLSVVLSFVISYLLYRARWTKMGDFL